MDRNSINLFKKRFLNYNRVRYADDDNWRIAFESLKVEDINVLKYMPDPESKYRTVLTEVQSDKFNLTGLDQQYTKAYFGEEIISILSDKTIYPDLVSVLNLNIRGVFFYANAEEPEFPHVVIATTFLRKWDEGLPFINDVMETINNYTHYDIELVECTIEKNEEDSSGERIVVDVHIDNHTIWGSIKVGQIPAMYPLGTYPYEYLGKFNEYHLIGKEELLTLANIPDSPLDEAARLDTPLVWLKFKYYGRVIFVPKRPILTGVSWDTLNAAKMTSGKTVIIGADGEEYRLRLLAVSPLYGENEWENLLQRCIDGTPLSEWERFNYNTEMHYTSGGIHSAILTEGIYESEPSYVVGTNGSAINAPVLVSKNATTVGQNSLGWLPVLELRGCDIIPQDTVHPHWVDLKDPVVDQLDYDQEVDPNMVFGIRLTSQEYVDAEDIDIDISVAPQDSAKNIFVTSVNVESLDPEATIIVQTEADNAAEKIVLLTQSNPALDEGLTSLSVGSTSDAFPIGFKRVSAKWASIQEGYLYTPDYNQSAVKHVTVKTTSAPVIGISEPYIKVNPLP